MHIYKYICIYAHSLPASKWVFHSFFGGVSVIIALGTLGPIALLPFTGSPSTFPSTTEGLLGAMVAMEI